MPLPSDTFHDKLFPCDQGDDAEYDHDHEVGLWLSMQPVYLCRRTPFMISSLHMTKVMMLIMIMTHEEGLWISMQPLCLCRRTPFIITFGVDHLVCLKSREFYCAIRVSYWDNAHVLSLTDGGCNGLKGPKDSPK